MKLKKERIEGKRRDEPVPKISELLRPDEGIQDDEIGQRPEGADYSVEENNRTALELSHPVVIVLEWGKLALQVREKRKGHPGYCSSSKQLTES